jgi:hypothetical protein
VWSLKHWIAKLDPSQGIDAQKNRQPERQASLPFNAPQNIPYALNNAAATYFV